MDGRDPALGDDEGPDGGGAVREVADAKGGLTADVHALDGQLEAAEFDEGADQHPGDVPRTVHRPGESTLPSAVAGERRVRCQQLDQFLELTTLCRRDEA